MTRTQTPAGFTLPRVLSSTLVDRDAPDLELEIINKLLPLLADKSHTVFDLCDVSGLNFDELATLLESPRVDKAYRAMVRILAIRQKFIDAQSHALTPQWDGLPARLSEPDGLEARPTAASPPRPAPAGRGRSHEVTPGEGSSKVQTSPHAHDEIVGFFNDTNHTQPINTPSPSP